MDIYFDDFKPATQQRILAEAGIKDPKEANWDVFPITQIILEDDNDK